jgi:RsiW-degrading membrane proteinase PrsW (M82 family)
MNISTIIYALLSGLLPALFWLWFWLKEDNLHPEPRSTIIKTFLGGALVVLIAIVLEKFATDIINVETTRYVVWAIIEEVVKLFIVVLVAFNSKNFDEPIDAMIYCITAALGFAALENTLFILSPLHNGEIAKGIVTLNMRFIGATLVHVVSSASIGFMIGISFYKNIFIKTISVIIGIIMAVVLHSAFNLSIINSSALNTIKVFSWVWCSTIILLILFEEIKIVKQKKL